MNEEPKNLEEPNDDVGERRDYPKLRRPYSKLAFDLDPSDLNQEGVQKMLLSEVSRLEGQVAELSEFHEKFYEKDKECAVLKTKCQKGTMLEILYTVAIASGAALLGWLPSGTAKEKTTIFIIAFALFAFALLAKWKGGKNEG